MIPKKRILLVDDHALLRRGLTSLIESDEGLTVCGEAVDHQGGLAAILSSEPDLVVADLSLEDSDGLGLIKDIKSRYPDLPVLALSMMEEATYAERALRAGARGFVSKQELDDTVLTAIRTLLDGGVHMSPLVSQRIAEKLIDGKEIKGGESMGQLSDRELEVFRWIGLAKSTREIAGILSLSVKTIESHREHLKRKLGVSTGAELNRRAVLWAGSVGEP